MKRYISVIFVVIALLALSACENLKPEKLPDYKLSDSKIRSIAIKLNEKLNFNNKTSEKYNLEYSNFHYETDGYDRYIVVLRYQYEDSQRNYHSGDVIVYFKYNNATGEYTYNSSNVKFPGLILDEEGWINRIKQEADFGWGVMPNGNSSTRPSPTPSPTPTTPPSSTYSVNFEGSYYNYFFRFDIFRNYDNPNTYSLIFSVERSFEIDGVLETGQHEILSKNYTTSYSNGNQIITFQIQDDPDYSGTISVLFDPSKPKGEQYYVCINIPAIAFDGATYTLINNVPY